MFDPTVFENLKVSFENQLYDLDNLDRKIRIISRIDRLEMAVMSRTFALQFILAGQEDVSAELWLEASLADLAAEILEQQGEKPACSLRLRFYMQVDELPAQCELVERVMQRIWEQEIKPTQTISHIYGQESSIYSNTIELPFNRKISEEQMDDIPELIEHMLQTLSELNNVTR